MPEPRLTKAFEICLAHLGPSLSPVFTKALSFHRSYDLDDMDDYCLDTFTKILRMPPGLNVLLPEYQWLEDQKFDLRHGPEHILSPTRLGFRVAVEAGSRGIPGFPPVAYLCRAHEALDPRVVRNVLQLVANECTMWSDCFRQWEGGMVYSPPVAGWLKRMDALARNFVPDEILTILRQFQPKDGKQENLVVASRCEACIYAVVGGRPQLMCDLAAGMEARWRDADSLPLMRLVRSWLKHGQVNEDVFDDEYTKMALLLRKAMEGLLRERGGLIEQDREKQILLRQTLAHIHNLDDSCRVHVSFRQRDTAAGPSNAVHNRRRVAMQEKAPVPKPGPISSQLGPSPGPLNATRNRKATALPKKVPQERPRPVSHQPFSFTSGLPDELDLGSEYSGADSELWREQRRRPLRTAGTSDPSAEDSDSDVSVVSGFQDWDGKPENSDLVSSVSEPGRQMTDLGDPNIPRRFSDPTAAVPAPLRINKLKRKAVGSANHGRTCRPSELGRAVYMYPPQIQITDADDPASEPRYLPYRPDGSSSSSSSSVATTVAIRSNSPGAHTAAGGHAYGSRGHFVEKYARCLE